MEAVSYHAISASVDLAAERGRYPSFEGSLWSKGILPIDSLDLLQDARDGAVVFDKARTGEFPRDRQAVDAVRTAMPP